MTGKNVVIVASLMRLCVFFLVHNTGTDKIDKEKQFIWTGSLVLLS